MVENIIMVKSFEFAVSIVKLYQYLCSSKKEYVLAKQLLRSGTSIGANVKEAVNAQSRKDFISKMNIALKEANECEYWIELLIRTDYLSETEGLTILNDCREINKILSSIVKTSKKRQLIQKIIDD
ncbi:S23 ribosomal protein [Thermincola ferriacetica]|uniref:S23 ribosomal protein n=2 Tax=Thermincola ferriacetica TaxID=281456 RepID=A0A0L6W3F4_9FIRM|nr:four helix bundle protein [Thermincola ferriacetica]KNZ69986.1 S23 ribosomal protein [Thermincola ferriacetica]